MRSVGMTRRYRFRVVKAPWWQGASVYQVYPRSFVDSDGDGIGDLPGIISRLDYIAGMGFDAVWVSPFFASPQRDGGYDITDYCDVAPEYGTLDDARRLVDAAHERGLRVVFDLVLNHTSDEHPWFVESRQSRTRPKADWYLWRDGRGPERRIRPNNWRAAVELQSAWHWGRDRRQWYLGTFMPFQPDLNWRNPDVREAMFDVVRFWLDTGVDGFRLDMFGAIMKDPLFRSNPLHPAVATYGAPSLWTGQYTANTEDDFLLAKDLRTVCDRFGGDQRLLLGEVFGRPPLLRKYLGDGDGLTHVFLFDFLTYRYDADFFRRRIAAYEESFPDPYEPTYVLENHDRARLMSRIAGDLDKARALAVLLLTLRGVATVYQGQEIGMTNTPLPLRGAKDPIPNRYFRLVPDRVARRLPEMLNRDEVRTPMQWDGTTHAGFMPADSRAAPWLPLNPNHATCYVAAQTGDESSLLELYRRLLHLRQSQPALRSGSLTLLDGLPVGVLGYRRSAPEGDLDVYVNFTDAGQQFPAVADTVLLASNPDASAGGGRLSLPANSGVVLGGPG
jgi:glycosidase